MLKQSRTEAKAKGCFCRHSSQRQTPAERNCAATVANAAPATPMCSPKINHRSNTMLQRLETTIAANGVAGNPQCCAAQRRGVIQGIAQQKPAVIRR